MDKFHPTCSCISCKQEFSIQNFGRHLKSHFNILVSKQCKNCSTPHFKSSDFCCKSCFAIFHNSRKDYTTFKSGPPKGSKPKTFSPRTKVSQCIICNIWFSGCRKTCSEQCFSQLMKIHAYKNKLGGNTDPNIQYYDSNNKLCYLDSMWEFKLANDLDKNHIKWVRPKRQYFLNGSSYTPDFYLLDYHVYIDPKAMRAGYYRDSKMKCQKFEQESGEKCIIITKYDNLSWSHIQMLLLLDIHWS